MSVSSIYAPYRTYEERRRNQERLITEMNFDVNDSNNIYVPLSHQHLDIYKTKVSKTIILKNVPSLSINHFTTLITSLCFTFPVQQNEHFTVQMVPSLLSSSQQEAQITEAHITFQYKYLACVSYELFSNVHTRENFVVEFKQQHQQHVDKRALFFANRDTEKKKLDTLNFTRLDDTTPDGDGNGDVDGVGDVDGGDGDGDGDANSDAVVNGRKHSTVTDRKIILQRDKNINKREADRLKEEEFRKLLTEYANGELASLSSSSTDNNSNKDKKDVHEHEHEHEHHTTNQQQQHGHTHSHHPHHARKRLRSDMDEGRTE